MRKQLTCFIFLFFVCLLMPSMAMAEVTLGLLSKPEFPGLVTAVDSITFTVEASEDGSPASGQSVTFSVSPDDGIASLSTTSATTDSNGQAQTTLSLSGNSSETHYKVSAWLSDGRETAYWIPVGAPVSGEAKLRLYLDQSRIYNAGESVGFRFSLRKVGTPGVSGKTVTFSVSPNDGTASLSTTSTTTSNGGARTTLVLGSDASGEYTVTATLDDGTSVSKSIGRVHNPNPTLQQPDFYLSMTHRSGPIKPGESKTFTATAQKYDGNWSYVSGETVTFSVSPNDGTVSLSPTSATTDSNGEASTTLITGSGSSGSYKVTASGGRHSISGTVTVDASSPPPTDPNPDPPVEINPPPEVVQISQDQQTAPGSPTGNTDAPEGSTGNTQGSTGNTSPTPGGSTGNTDAPEGPTGNTQGTPPSALGVSIPVISKTVLDSGESFTLSVTVENTGEGLSPETTLRYYRSSGVGESGTEVGQKSVSPIAAMGTSDVSISLSAPDTPGTYLYYACISSVTGVSSTGNTCSPNSVELKVRGEPQDPSEPQGTSKYDVNGDGAVDIEDAALVAGAFGTNTAKYDVNGDGSVDVADLLLIITNRQAAAGAPSVVGMKFTAVQIDRIEVQVGLLAATNDRAPAAMQTLAYLRNLIAMARPEKTQLLANYPNPFNPETWIPYRLAAAANVTLTIYDINGQVVRKLALGHQAAGVYQSRSRAAYWDGKNAFGEPVASGLYFYTLTAGDFTATRKMLIRK